MADFERGAIETRHYKYADGSPSSVVYRRQITRVHPTWTERWMVSIETYPNAPRPYGDALLLGNAAGVTGEINARGKLVKAVGNVRKKEVVAEIEQLWRDVKKLQQNAQLNLEGLGGTYAAMQREAGSTLPRSDVRALAAFLRQHGRKLPRLGYCMNVPPGPPAREVCRDSQGYFWIGWRPAASAEYEDNWRELAKRRKRDAQLNLEGLGAVKFEREPQRFGPADARVFYGAQVRIAGASWIVSVVVGGDSERLLGSHPGEVWFQQRTADGSVTRSACLLSDNTWAAISAESYETRKAFIAHLHRHYQTSRRIAEQARKVAFGRHAQRAQLNLEGVKPRLWEA